MLKTTREVQEYAKQAGGSQECRGTRQIAGPRMPKQRSWSRQERGGERSAQQQEKPAKRRVNRPPIHQRTEHGE